MICREVLLGLTGKDYVLIASSKAAMRGISILKAEDDKTRTLTDHMLMAFTGEAGDTSMCPSIPPHSSFPKPSLLAFFLPSSQCSGGMDGNKGIIMEHATDRNVC